MSSPGLPWASKAVFTRLLRETREAAGLAWVTWPHLRHTYASWLAEAGVPLLTISRWLGNTTRVAERHYVGIAPGGDASIARAFPAA